MKGIIVTHAKWKKIWQVKSLIESTNQDLLVPVDFADLKQTECDFILQPGMPNEAKKYMDDVYEGIRNKNKPVLIKELPILRSINGISVNAKGIPFEKQWYRFSWNHYFLDTGIHPYDPTYDRWSELQSKYNIEIHDWKSRGDAILFNCQLYGDSALARIWDNGRRYEDVVFETIEKIKLTSDRPIIIRQHPKDSKMKNLLKIKYSDDKRVTISSLPDLHDDFNRAWCTVTYNSTSCVESVLYGLPTFTLDTSALTNNLIPNSVNDIEKKINPDRHEWCKRIAFMQWSGEEMISGYPWNLLRNCMPSK